MKALETAMKVSMTDVFWLQERWKIYLGKKTSLLSWLGDENIRGAKRHRALIWSKDSDKDLELPSSCLHGDIDYERATGKDVDELKAIDESKNLPIDFILVFSKDTELREKARELGIPVFPVSMFSK
jgi:hypothetical protein